MVTSVQRASVSGNEAGKCPPELRPVVAALFQRDGARAIAALERLEVDELQRLAPCVVSRGLLTALRASGPRLRRFVLDAAEQWASEYAPTQASEKPPHELPAWLYESDARADYSPPTIDPRAREAARQLRALAELFGWLSTRLFFAEIRGLNVDGLLRFANAKTAAVQAATPAATPAAMVLQWVMNASERTYQHDSLYFATRLRDAVSPDPSKVDVAEVARLLTLAAVAWSKRTERVHNFYDKATALAKALGVEGAITRSNVSKWRRDMVVVDPFALDEV